MFNCLGFSESRTEGLQPPLKKRKAKSTKKLASKATRSLVPEDGEPAGSTPSIKLIDFGPALIDRKEEEHGIARPEVVATPSLSLQKALPSPILGGLAPQVDQSDLAALEGEMGDQAHQWDSTPYTVALQ